MGVYFPVSILTSMIFLTINLLLVPFAYVKTCCHKIKLAHANLIPVIDVFSYMFLGLFMGIIVQIPDLWGFLKSSWIMKKPINTGKTPIIDRWTFIMFYQLIKDLGLQSHSIRAFDLIGRVRKILDIESAISLAIYGVDFRKG